jgi:hypothetical protein
VTVVVCVALAIVCIQIPISTSICFVDSFNRWCDWQHTKQIENLSLSYIIPLIFHYVLHNRREYLNQSKKAKERAV